MTALVPQDGPAVGADTEAAELRAGVAPDTGPVDHGDVPLVEALVILDHGVFLPNIFHHPRPLVVQHNKTCIEARPEEVMSNVM